MADLLRLGVSGLLTSQQQLATTGHNIANVNNEDFSRQNVTQVTTDPFNSGSYFTGTGTTVSTISRVYDQFKYNEVIYNQTLTSEAETTAQKLQSLDQTMSIVGTGITDSLNDLFASVNALVDVPGDLGLRDIMLGKAQTLSNSMNTIQNALDTEYSVVNEDLVESANSVSKIAEEIAYLNNEIHTASLNGLSPNDLLDQRDALIKDLSAYTTVSTTQSDDGLLNVYIAGGQTLVTGTTTFSLAAQAGNPDPLKTELYIESPSGVQHQLSSENVGGSMGALLSYRNGILSETSNTLGQMSIVVADAFNTVQSQGMDLNGLEGQNLFQDINEFAVTQDRFFGNEDNTGTITGTVEITDASILTNDDYDLDYDGGVYTLTNKTTGDSQVLTADDPAAPVGSRTFTTDDGFSFTESGGVPQNGDSYLLLPTRSGARDLNVNLIKAEQIATSSIVEVYESDDNVNSADVSITSVFDTSSPGFPTDGNSLTLEVYESPVGTFNYSVLDSNNTPQALFDENGVALGTSATYTGSSLNFQVAGMAINLNGVASGETANAPERYEIEYAVGSGNNQNILAMASLVDTKLANDGSSTISDLYEESVTSVGSETSKANIAFDTANILFAQAETRMSNTSGVNLDEEASDLLRYQQAYSASARVISTASEIFQTLLQAVQ